LQEIWESTGGHGGIPPESPQICPDFLIVPGKGKIWDTRGVSVLKSGIVDNSVDYELNNDFSLEFIRLLAEEKIPYLDYTPEELDAELKALERWPTE
jgi:hypothetical protein